MKKGAYLLPGGEAKLGLFERLGSKESPIFEELPLVGEMEISSRECRYVQNCNAKTCHVNCGRLILMVIILSKTYFDVELKGEGCSTSQNGSGVSSVSSVKAGKNSTEVVTLS